MRYVVVFVALAALIACHRGSNDQTAYMRHVPLPTLTPVNSFVAVDYQKPGQPKLTAAQIALIRKTINVVKPCQRALLRYSFDLDDPSRMTIDLYFRRDDPADLDSHVLWQGDVYYFFEQGFAHAEPFDNGPTPDWSIRADIANTPCR